MSWWNTLSEWLRRVLESTETLADAQTLPERLRPRVLMVVYNPTIQGEAGRRLTDVLGWNDPSVLAQHYMADLKECSGGFVEYEIAERVEVDGWPVKADGFRYGEGSFLGAWRSGSGFHQPDAADYDAILEDLGLFPRVESGAIDEVWLFASPYAGFYESRMVGPGAFWCNAPPMVRTDGISRRFVIMGFNFERGVGPMLESFSHRVESHLKRVWRHEHGANNLWERFILYDKVAPGQANCGNVHFAPNSQTDYDWGNPRLVPSNCDDWLNFPNFQGVVRQVNGSEWGDGDMRAHHKWWLRHLPRVPGQTQGIANNWWWYAVEPNAVR
jgi:hypothetical protein